MRQARQLLKKHDLRLTDSRVQILKLFFNQKSALSQPDIEKAIGNACDRVTIYRTLTSFLEKGLVHKVLDDAGAAKYALCDFDCEEEHYHVHNHVHFKCNECAQTICMSEVSIPSIALPASYQIQEVNVLFQGICSDCSPK